MTYFPSISRAVRVSSGNDLRPPLTSSLRGDVPCVQPCREAGRLAAPDTVPHDSHGGAGWARELQASRLLCKPICKPDAARQRETGETEPTGRDEICPVRRGHHARERLPETPETDVVVLITQRSRVQIPPPLLISQVKGLFRSRKRPLAYPCANGRGSARTSPCGASGDRRTPGRMPTVATDVADLLHFTGGRHPCPRSP